MASLLIVLFNLNFSQMKKIIFAYVSLILFAGCSERSSNGIPVSYNFIEVGQTDIGDEDAAEIAAHDPLTQQLFVVNNDGLSTVDILDFSDPSNPTAIGFIDIATFGGGVNSVAVKNGLLAIAVQGYEKTDNGSVVIFNTEDLITPLKVVPVGALPDMVTFSPNGKLIISANEGEPNDEYTIDPEGTISIIEVEMDFAVSTLGFSAFESQKTDLIKEGYRVFGPGATLSQDTEPEYVAVDSKSEFAWVTLQENNGVAKVDLKRKQIVDIFPMGLKDLSKKRNELDVSDRDGGINFGSWPVKSYYLPDAIATYQVGGNDFYITANEGDTRDYDGYAEESRVKDLILDPAAFPNAAELQKDENLGRYTATTSNGDFNGDGKFEAIFGIGGRSFSIWNGQNGELLNDYSQLEKDFVASLPTAYDDGRSDNKGVEPESVTVGEVYGKTYLFVGLERADAVMVYELSGIGNVRFVQVLQTGDAPEGLLFIPALESPNGKATIIVSSEGDGKLKVFQN